MVQKYFTLLVLLLAAHFVTAQITTLEDLDRKSTKKYKKALACLKKGETAEGLMKLEEVISKYPNFSKGSEKLIGLYLKNGQNEQAQKMMEQLNASSAVPLPKVAMSLADIYEEKAEYDKAILQLHNLQQKAELTEKQKSIVDRRLIELQFRKQAYDQPLDINPVRLSDSINTSDIEYHPGLNADGSLVIYVKVKDGKFRHEDLYFSTKMPDGTYTDGLPIESLNTQNQEGAFSLSQDGNILIFTGCDYRDSYGGCDLYISFRKGNGWSAAQNMGPTINSRYWESSPSLTADSRALFFSSKRPGGEGGSDLYYVELGENNKWSEPKNLGSTINTASNDEAPFIHPDGTSLYFISDGHIGLGSYDIFLAKKSGDTWSTPTNLGYPINTEKREGGLFIDLQGNRAYYSSQIDFEKKDSTDAAGDIYYFDLPEIHKPKLITYIKVEVRDAKSGGLINSKAEIKSLTEAVGYDRTININGVLLTTIQPGDYALTISKKGYLFHSENIQLDKSATFADPFIFKVNLQPIPKVLTETVKEPAPIVLNNIFFATGSAELLPSSDGEINKLIQLLQAITKLNIKILGHTDNVGSEQSNLNLSTARAKAVRDRITLSGISANRIQYEGKGESAPIADNETESGRQKNRRTEFILIE